MIDKRNPIIELGPKERCDRCGAKAYARAHRDGLELLFCLHHAKQHNLALELDDWKVDYDTIGLSRLISNEEVLV